MDRVIQVVIVAMCGLTGVTLTTFWLDRLIKRMVGAFNERAQEHDKQLVILNVEIQLARHEVSRLQSELAAVRFAVERFIDDLPPVKRPPMAPS